MNRRQTFSYVLLLLTSFVTAGCSAKKPPTRPVPTGPASLVVVSVPSGVPVTLDGTATGNSTPNTFSVAAGSHRVGLRLLGYRDTTVTLMVSAATVETLSVALGPGPGTPRSLAVWQQLPDIPSSIAAGTSGPVYVTVGTIGGNPGALLVFSLAGTQLGQSSLGYGVSNNLTVTAAVT